MSTILEADTLLAIDVGSVNTRASLFDVVDGRYRLVATGRAASTAGPPLFDVSEGVRIALDRVQAITGRRLLDESEALLMPTTSSTTGVDIFAATSSAGPNVRTVIIGLMPGVSMESANRLAASTYLDVIETIGLMDHHRDDEQIDMIMTARPDLILLVGGTDGGATVSVKRIAETISMAVNLFPEHKRPVVVYAGNSELAGTIIENFGDRFPVGIVPNVRPSLRHEDLAPARLQLAEVISEARSVQVAGFEELKQWSGGNLMLTADAFGRVIRYLSRVYDPDKGVLGIDLGASHTAVGAAFDGELNLKVRNDLGVGSSMPGIFKVSNLTKVHRWLPIEISESRLRDYIFNKALNPGTVPADLKELHIEYAFARQIIRSALFDARENWPVGRDVDSSLLMPAMEPILASGATIARTPKPGYAALVLLDAIQPTGITTLVLDPYSLIPALGAASGPLPMVTVQVLESGSFVSLGTVVAPVGQGRRGKSVLRVRLERESNDEVLEGEVRFGQLAVLPLRQGEHGRLTLRPERGFDVGFGGSGKAGAIRVTGGAVGLIIDARGRPLQLPNDHSLRQELNQKWLWDIGAME
jgi:hypothetical protein